MQHLYGSLHAVDSLRSFIMEVRGIVGTQVSTVFLNGLVSTGQLSADLICGGDASALVVKIGDLGQSLLVFC